MVKRTEFDEALEEIKGLLVHMSDLVRKALDQSVEALQNADVELAEQVVARDPMINRLEEDIEDLGSRLIATQQPVAKDLRVILTGFRIANDLERMADLSVDIAKVVLRLKDQPLLKPLVDIPRMAEIVEEMMSEGIAAYADENLEQAYRMAKMDDEVDNLYSQMLRELFSYMVENPETISQGMLLTFVGRYIERIADHATNIAESVVYLVSNKRIDLN